MYEFVSLHVGKDVCYNVTSMYEFVSLHVGKDDIDVVELLERIHCLEVQLFIGLAHGHRRLALIRKHRVLNLVRDRCNRSE